MSTISISVGDIIVKDGIRFRVIGHVQELVSVICMDTKKMSITVHSAKDLYEQFRDNNIQIVPHNSEERRAFNASALSESSQEVYKRNTDFVNRVAQSYGPLFTGLMGKKTKPDFVQAYTEAGIKSSRAWLIIGQYLKSGLDPASLVDQRAFRDVRKPYNYTKKAGHPANSVLGKGVILTEEDIAHMEEARQYFLSGRARTIKSAYEEMVSRYYTKCVEITDGVRFEILPANQRPTQKQFYGYVTKNTDTEIIRIAKTSAQEYRNAERLLLSDNLHGVSGPGSLFEVDECELDVSIVSEINNSITVGRPILYAIVDVYTRMIVAVSISFDNNSIIGITSCLINLLDDKQEFFARYGINIEPGEFPSHIIPQRIRSDYGSEYISYEMERIGRELGIQMELASPGSGSLKGQVEQLFHQLHTAQNPSLENRGLIERRHDSRHHREATLTLTELTEMVLATVAVHNRTYLRNYPKTQKMRACGLKPTPVNLWKFGVENSGAPRPIINEDSFRYTLLTPVNATISRAGVCFEDLYYLNTENAKLVARMINAQNTREPFECRIDPRNVGALYYLDNAKLVRIPLNTRKTGMAEWEGVSLAEYRALRREKLNEDREGEEMNLQLDIALHNRHENIVRNAAKRKKGNNTVTGMRKNRRTEKQNAALAHSIVPPEETAELPTSVLPVIDAEPERIPETLEEALKAYEEDEDARYD